MSDDGTQQDQYGMRWWKSLSTLEKQAVVEPLISAGKSNKDIVEILGLETTNQVAGVRNRINKRKVDYVSVRSLKKEVAQTSRRTRGSTGPPGPQIVDKITRRRKDLTRAAQTQQAETEETPVPEPVESPPPPPTERDRIIEEEVRKWKPPSPGPFREDPRADRKAGTAMHTLFGKLIDAGVAL